MSNFKIGDFITAYQKGYHKIVDIKGVSIHYIRVVSDAGNIVKSTKIMECSKSWCSLIDIEALISKRREELDMLHRNLIIQGT